MTTQTSAWVAWVLLCFLAQLIFPARGFYTADYGCSGLITSKKYPGI